MPYFTLDERTAWIDEVRVSHGTDEVGDELLLGTIYHMVAIVMDEDHILDGPTKLGEETADDLGLYSDCDEATIADWVWTLAAIVWGHYEK